MFICEDYLDEQNVYEKNSKSFTWGSQGDANFWAELQKYIIPAALHIFEVNVE